MPITINGSGTVTGLSVDGLPAGTVGSATLTDLGVATGDIAASAVTPAKLSQPFTQMTAVAYTSFTTTTYNDFTGIPSWVKRITVMFNGVSLSSTAHLLVQIGSGSITSSGYVASSSFAGTTGAAGSTSTAGYILHMGNAAYAAYGSLVITNVSSNIWVASGVIQPTSSFSSQGAGQVSLGGALDRVRITSNSTDTFDAGSVNVMYE
jgi:hypothetical protein